MASKDRYGNNLRRGDRVKDLRDGSNAEGQVVGTSSNSVYVQWDDGEEETIRGGDLVLADQRFGRRRG